MVIAGALLAAGPSQATTGGDGDGCAQALVCDTDTGATLHLETEETTTQTGTGGTGGSDTESGGESGDPISFEEWVAANCTIPPYLLSGLPLSR